MQKLTWKVGGKKSRLYFIGTEISHIRWENSKKNFQLWVPSYLLRPNIQHYKNKWRTKKNWKTVGFNSNYCRVTAGNWFAILLFYFFFFYECNFWFCQLFNKLYYFLYFRKTCEFWKENIFLWREWGRYNKNQKQYFSIFLKILF